MIKHLVQFTLAQRRIIAKQRPELRKHLAMSEVKTVRLALSELELDQIRDAAQANVPTARGNSRNSLKRIINLVTESFGTEECIYEIPPQERIYQFRIELRGSEIPVWRRIQVPDNTLQDLQEDINAAVGWPTSGTHRFLMKDNSYCDVLSRRLFPDYYRSDDTMLSDTFPDPLEEYHFGYVYNLRPTLLHDVFFEGCLEAQKRLQYPLCVEGKGSLPNVELSRLPSYSAECAAIADDDLGMFALFGNSRGFAKGPFDPVSATKRMRLELYA